LNTGVCGNLFGNQITIAQFESAAILSVSDGDLACRDFFTGQIGRVVKNSVIARPALVSQIATCNWFAAF